MAKRSPIKSEDEWFQGETKLLEFTIETAAEDGSPQLISGWTIQWQLMNHQKSQDTVFTKPAVITDDNNGLVQVTVDPTDTNELEPRTYWHELWRMDTGFEAVLSYGPAVLQ